MVNSIKRWLNRVKTSGVVQTVIGFVSFLVIASVMMLFLESSGDNSGIKDLFNSLWFSIVTITTVGYGDISPITSLGKIAAVVIMFIGIIYIGVLTGNITSWLVERNRRRVLGLVPLRKRTDHFLILGWRQGMNKLLKDILSLHDIHSSNVVLVNAVDAQEINDLKQDDQLKEISFFAGDFTSKDVLQNACGNTASKVLIISELFSGKSTDEIDFRTVLATIAIKRINPGIYAIVEIVQPKFSLYLQHVEVEEIILNRFSSRALISNIALMSGLNSVFSKLFSMKDGLLKIEPIQLQAIGKTYQELKQNHGKGLVIGVIENSGSLRKIKLEMMNQVQQSVSIKMAIQRLTDIKTLKSNLPILHPAPSYIIKENSSMIILDTQPDLQDAGESSRETMSFEEAVPGAKEGYLSSILKNALQKIDNWDALTDLLNSLKIEFYSYGSRINGLVYNNCKYTLASLAFNEKEIGSIQSMYLNRRVTKEIIRSRFDTFFEKSSDWDELFARLRREGIEFYLYRKKVNGLKIGDKKFSFNALDIDEEIVREITNYKGAKSKVQFQGKVKDLDRDFQSLATLKNELKIKETVIQPSSSNIRILMICGWKPQLTEMLNFIVGHYSKHQPGWNKISIVADITDEMAEKLATNFNGNVALEIHQGTIVDRETLKKAGIGKAVKVVILAETESNRSHEEIDSQTVLTAMLIGNLNKKTYKVAEILDNRYKESLEQVNVEEIYLEDEFSRTMLSYGSHGMGMTRVFNEIININKTALNLTHVDESYVNAPFKNVINDFNSPGELIIGLLEETGNIYARKSEKIQLAQIQSNIKGQVEELTKVKELVPNQVVIAPPLHYKINSNSKLIILNTSDTDGWNAHCLLSK